MKNHILIIASLFTLTIMGCKREGCTDSLATNYEEKAKNDDGSCEYPDADLSIEFKHSVNDVALEFDAMNYTSATNNKYSVKTLKYFVSDIIIHGANSDVELNQDLYIDAMDNTTTLNAMDKQLAPGDYTGITFVFGFTPENNTSGKYTNAPESNMEWPETMGGGWHFMKLEGQYDSLSTGNVKNYATHIGNTMMANNHFIVHFDYDFTIKGETEVQFILGMDIDNWYKSPNAYDFNDYDNGIMMNQAAQTILKDNGENDVFYFDAVVLEE